MELSILKKKLIYRSRNRGCRETDLLLGKFVVNNIENLTEGELKLLDNLLEESDQDLYEWITKRSPLPKRWNNSLMKKIIES